MTNCLTVLTNTMNVLSCIVITGTREKLSFQNAFRFFSQILLIQIFNGNEENIASECFPQKGFFLTEKITWGFLLRFFTLGLDEGLQIRFF